MNDDSSVFDNQHENAQPSVAQVPAEAFPLGEYLKDEMDARHWTSRDVALRMGGATLDEVALDQLCVDLILHIDDPNLMLDEATAIKLGRAFDVSPQYFLNIDRAYREWKTAAPQTVADGLHQRSNTDESNNNSSATTSEGE